MKRGNLRLLEQHGQALLERVDEGDYTGISLDMEELNWLVLMSGPAILNEHLRRVPDESPPGHPITTPFDEPPVHPGQETLEIT